MKYSINLSLIQDNGKSENLPITELPYSFGRKGYFSFGSLQGQDIGNPHCHIASDSEEVFDRDSYTGVCILHLDRNTLTLVDDCTLGAQEFVSILWDQTYRVQIGRYVFELCIDKPKKRQRSGWPAQPGCKSSVRGKGRKKQHLSNEERIVPTSKREKRGKGRNRS